ncbi:hypothetical protein GCM10022199_18970 [Marihabitans asiaticum]|nr:Sec-independent protein translocase subunit TatA [Marihabitans asiaticum]
MPSLGPMEIILILVVILLLFGFKKLPDAARSLGKSARVFKSEVNEMKEEDRQREEARRTREQGTLSGSAPTGSTSTTRSEPVRDTEQHAADGNAMIDESRPRTDNQSGPVS